MMASQSNVKNYVSQFRKVANKLPGGEQDWVRQTRENALKRFETLGFPSARRQEEWKHTPLKELSNLNFEVDSPIALPDVSVLEPLLLDTTGPRLVFVNGKLIDGLSRLSSLPTGVELRNLAEVLSSPDADAKEMFALRSSFKDAPFANLNTAFASQGIYLSVERDTLLEAPIYLVFLATEAAEGRVSHPRNLISLQPGSRATLIEHHVSLGSPECFNNVLTQIVVQDGAHFEYTKLQNESLRAFHLGNVQVELQKNSTFHSNCISLGGALGRTRLDVHLAAEGADCTLNGLYLATGKQHVDNRTRIEHGKPNCRSREFYKGILGGKATGVFDGVIVVRPDAQKSDAALSNRNLLLSDDASINFKPQFEIYADDVKCAHGATSGQLDENAIFYLKSRGIPSDEARVMLTYAFANEVVKKMGGKSLRSYLEKVVQQWLEKV